MYNFPIDLTLFVCVEPWICVFPEGMVESRAVWKHLAVVQCWWLKLVLQVSRGIGDGSGVRFGKAKIGCRVGWFVAVCLWIAFVQCSGKARWIWVNCCVVWCIVRLGSISSSVRIS